MVGSSLAMALYSLLLLGIFVLGAPYWLARMAGSGRYRAGLWGRLGRVPAQLRAAVAGCQVVWLHAVSVGEVLAATRLVAELETALGDGWIIVISTTTATGQKLAQERFGASRVFWYPLDFAWAVRAYLRVLQPRLLVLMESELWPRMLVECARASIPVAVVNARVSDRSYARGVKVRGVWGHVLRMVTEYLAQTEEDARRLVAMGARSEAVRMVGNLKYDVKARESWITEGLGPAINGRPVVVAGSTSSGEENVILDAWHRVLASDPSPLLILAPRHPERFPEVVRLINEHKLRSTGAQVLKLDEGNRLDDVQVLMLDTVGDLAATYGLSDVAFVGGSLVAKGGHNPLEPAQFGVPVVMGPSFENFRDVVGKMQAADGIRIVQDKDELEAALVVLLADREKAKKMGERGRRVFEEKQGATARALKALLELVKQ
jgi:3-deoxy-D-manno-octulosonic-acid transferase